MKTHVALSIALTAGAIAIGSVAARADDDGDGKVVISTKDAPTAIGPYSQAIRVGRSVYVSGEVGVDPVTGKIPTDIGAQTGQALTNIENILHAAGLTLGNVVATTVYLVVNVQDGETLGGNFTAMNMRYATFFPNAPPSRATIQVAGLPKQGASVEISAVAVAPE